MLIWVGDPSDSIDPLGVTNSATGNDAEVTGEPLLHIARASTSRFWPGSNGVDAYAFTVYGETVGVTGTGADNTVKLVVLDANGPW